MVLTAFQATATATPVTLCVGVAPLQVSTDRGQVAQWEVGAWTEGGNVPDAKIQLQSTAGAGTPSFSFGCASGDGTSLCDLGAVDATSAQRLFQAEVTVPLTATAITAVSLTATGSAANLARDPAASGSVLVLAPGSPAGASLLPLPGITASGFPTPTVSTGGNAADLFPSLGPSTSMAGATPVANVAPLSGGSALAEGAGLAALGVAVLLAIARVSLRRPAARHAANSTVAAAPPRETAASVASETDRSAV